MHCVLLNHSIYLFKSHHFYKLINFYKTKHYLNSVEEHLRAEVFIAPGTLEEESSEAFGQKRCHQGKLTLAGMQCQIPQSVCDIGNKKHFVCEAQAGHLHKACDVTEGRGVLYHNYEIS